MAFLNICGFETGDTSELIGAGGTYSVQSSIKRTGTYALRINPTTTGTGYGQVWGLAADGTAVPMSAATMYCTWYGYIATLPSSSEEVFAVYVNDGVSGDSQFELRVTSGGVLKLYRYNPFTGPTWNLVATGTTALSTGTWYRIDWKATAGGSAVYELKIDGTVELSGTQAMGGTNMQSIMFGKVRSINNQSVDFYYDDIAISDSAYPGAGQVNILVPTAAGTESTGWASGTGATYAEVDEIPHDSDTTYIKSTASGDARNYNLTDSATAGVAGTVGAVKFCAINRNEGGAPSGHVRWGKTSISASTSTSTAAFPASYGLIAGISSTWTTTADVDALILGVAQVGTSLAARCTALYAMVWSTGQINTTVTPSAASLTLTAYTPSSVVGTKLTPGALSLTTTRYTPTVLTPVVGTPGALALTMTPYAPSVTIGLTVTPGALALALTAYTPTVINPQSATPGTLALALTAYEPGAVVNSIVTPGALTTALTAYAPAALLNNIVTPGALSASLTAYAPSAIVNFIVTPGAGSLAIATYGINIYLPGSAFGARQYWRSTQHKEYTKLVPYRDYRRVTTYKDYIKSVKWVDRA